MLQSAMGQVDKRIQHLESKVILYIFYIQSLRITSLIVTILQFITNGGTAIIKPGDEKPQAVCYTSLIGSKK